MPFSLISAVFINSTIHYVLPHSSFNFSMVQEKVLSALDDAGVFISGGLVKDKV